MVPLLTYQNGLQSKWHNHRAPLTQVKTACDKKVVEENRPPASQNGPPMLQLLTVFFRLCILHSAVYLNLICMHI